MQTGAIIRSRGGLPSLVMNRSMSQRRTKNKNALAQQINSSIYHNRKVFPLDMNPTQLLQIRFFQTVEAGPLAFPRRALCWVQGESGKKTIG